MVAAFVVGMVVQVLYMYVGDLEYPITNTG